MARLAQPALEAVARVVLVALQVAALPAHQGGREGRRGLAALAGEQVCAMLQRRTARVAQARQLLSAPTRRPSLFPSPQHNHSSPAQVDKVLAHTEGLRPHGALNVLSCEAWVVALVERDGKAG